MVEFVVPKIFKIGESITAGGLEQFLQTVGAEPWWNERWERDADAFDMEGQTIIELAGRSCYKSWGTDSNPNLTAIRPDAKSYLDNTLAKGDGSIFEHATVTFAFVDVSRVFTHELVRHRGTAFSQESLRFSRPKTLRIVRIPGSEQDAIFAEKAAQDALERAWEGYSAMVDKFLKPDMPFDQKKKWTSALRRLLPDQATLIIFTGNHRALRHILTMRTHPAAETEMRYVFDRVGDILLRDFPLIYADFDTSTKHDDGIGKWWKPRYNKA